MECDRQRLHGRARQITADRVTAGAHLAARGRIVIRAEAVPLPRRSCTTACRSGDRGAVGSRESIRVLLAAAAYVLMQKLRLRAARTASPVPARPQAGRTNLAKITQHYPRAPLPDGGVVGRRGARLTAGAHRSASAAPAPCQTSSPPLSSDSAPGSGTRPFTNDAGHVAPFCLHG
jgi:hypothetical protein